MERMEVKRLTRKQSEILKWLHIQREQAVEELDANGGSLTTYDIFELVTQVQIGDLDEDPGFVGWDREGISATLRRLEGYGLVRRVPPTELQRGHHDFPHWLPGSGAGPVDGRRGKARHAWQITGDGFRTLEAACTATPESEESDG